MHFIDFIGLAIEAPFFGDTLDKLDVARRVQQRHEYKGAGEMFVRRGFSEEARRSLKALIDSWMSDITAAVAEARNLTPAQVRRLTDTGPFLAEEALDNGLIDARNSIGCRNASRSLCPYQNHMNRTGEHNSSSMIQNCRAGDFRLGSRQNRSPP